MIELRSTSGRLLPTGRKKYDKNTKAAISQIKDRHYPQKIADYTGDILLVGINYDKDTKQHDCQIERWQKEL